MVRTTLRMDMTFEVRKRSYGTPVHGIHIAAPFQRSRMAYERQSVRRQACGTEEQTGIRPFLFEVSTSGRLQGLHETRRKGLAILPISPKRTPKGRRTDHQGGKTKKDKQKHINRNGSTSTVKDKTKNKRPPPSPCPLPSCEKKDPEDRMHWADDF